MAISLSFAEEAPQAADPLGGSRLSVDWSLHADGSFGRWSAKLEEDHFTSPQFGFGLSGFLNYGHLGLRLSALGKYQAVYVSEGTEATINEGFWKLGGGAAIRVQNSHQSGAWAELGAAAQLPLKSKISLVENEAQNIHWELKSKVEVPVELAIGYRVPVKAIFLDAAFFGAYDLNKPLSLRANERTVHAKALNIGARISLGGGLFK